MKKSILLLAITLFYVTKVNAQDIKKIRGFEIEADPIAYIFNGYSLHIIPQIGQWRFNLGAFGIKQPEFFHGNEGFDLYTQGAGIKVNYLFKNIDGFYAGIDAGYLSHKAEFLSSSQKETGQSLSAGIMGGYRHFFFKDKMGQPSGLYVTPWLGISHNFNFDPIEFSDSGFNQSKWTFFPTIHLGYRF